MILTYLLTQAFNRSFTVAELPLGKICVEDPSAMFITRRSIRCYVVQLRWRCPFYARDIRRTRPIEPTSLQRSSLVCGAR